jgi:hypothetical protein
MRNPSNGGLKVGTGGSRGLGQAVTSRGIHTRDGSNPQSLLTLSYLTGQELFQPRLQLNNLITNLF